MADIISGKSRFDGDKNAPVRKIISINREVENSSEDAASVEQGDVLDESSVRSKIRRHRIRTVLLVVSVIVVVVVGIYIVGRIIDNYSYSSYSIADSVTRDDTESSQYIAYGDGYVRYSYDGISYYKNSGKVVWNQTYSMQNPRISWCDNTLVVADIDGSSAYSFNEDGLIGKTDTSLPILQAEVSSDGKIVAVLEDTNANYINMYDTSGEKIYSVKTTLSGDGYPLDISISSDGKKLVASYVSVSGSEIKSNLVFYNFSEVGENETERVVGGFNYEDIIVGDVQFINDTMAVAIGEDRISIYKIKEYPSLEKTVEIDNEIQKVVFGEQYIGLVLDNSDSGEPYKLVVYNTSGNEVFSITYGTEYTNVYFDGKSVIMSNSSKLVLLNMGGNQLADIEFDMSIVDVLPTGTRGTYIVVNSKYIQTIKLK